MKVNTVLLLVSCCSSCGCCSSISDTNGAGAATTATGSGSILGPRRQLDAHLEYQSHASLLHKSRQTGLIDRYLGDARDTHHSDQLSITRQTPAFQHDGWRHAVSRRDDGWQPYADNGGTLVAVAGRDYVIVAADTRLSDSYNILTRKVSRVHRIGEGRRPAFLAAAGCWADAQGLLRLVQLLAADYAWAQQRPLSTEALARLLSNYLYYRRDFPYYAFSVVAGLDADGAGAVYGYDSIGSFERVKVACAGSGRSLLQPIMDRLAHTDEENAHDDAATAPPKPLVDAPLEEALALVKQGFAAAAEREISVGDSAEVVVVTRQGVERHLLELRQD